MADRGIFLQVLGLRSISFSARSLTCAASLLLVSAFVVGCASVNSTQPPSPSLSFSATTFNFQNVVVGQTAKQTLTISNTGTASASISSLSVSNKQFSIAGPSTPQSIPSSGSLVYTVSFAPTAAGSASATVSVTTSVSSVPDSISLSGTGEKALATLAVTPVSINFGNLVLKTTGTQNVTLQNTGNISLTLQGITVAGSGFGYSSLSPGFSLAPSQKVVFQVWFSPTVVGPAAATVSLLSPSLSSPATLSLSGDGVSSTNPPPNPTPTQHTVRLTWGPSSSQIIGYRVYRSEVSGSSFSPMNGTAITALAYDDATVANGTTYYYVVTAVDTSGTESVHSNQATAVIPAS